jgi:hypothetical protein
MATEEHDKLQSDHYVFFIGAGASRSMGYPLMSTFLDDVKAAYPMRTGGSAERKRRAFRVLLTFRSYLSSTRDFVNTDFDNIEALYSAAEMFAMAYPDSLIGDGDDKVAGKDIPKEIALVIWEMCRIRPFENQVHVAPSPHSDLLRIMCDFHAKHTSAGFLSKVAIITTNYDYLLELAAWKASVPHCYGRNVQFDEVLPVNSGNSSGMRLLKLHGSVNWFVNEEQSLCDSSLARFDKGLGHSMPERYNWPSIQAGNYEIREGFVPLIMPPSFAKKAAHRIFQTVWTEAIEVISKAKMLVFIGYSFPRTDTFVHQLLHIGLTENADLREVILVDPNPEVGNYARNEVFNRVFSDKRVAFLNTPFDVTSCAYIKKAMTRLEKRAVL